MQQNTIYVGGGLAAGKSYYTGTENKFFASPMKDMREKTVLVEEDNNKNDSYRQHTKYDDKIDSYYSTYDVGILTGNRESYLEGWLSSKEDVDYYSFSYPKGFYSMMGISSEITIQLEEFSEGADYSITVYDMDGNQIGIAMGDEGCKQVVIPDWVKSNEYTIRVENRATGEVGDGSYRIKISETRDTEKSSTNIQSAKEQSESDYLDQVNRFHQEQYDCLPENEKYDGTETVSQLLEKMASGKALSQQEKDYIKIFASVTDYEKAEASGKINTVLYSEVINYLKQAGIDVTGKDLEIELGKEHKLIVTEGGTTKRFIEIDREFADRLWDSYLQASDISGDMQRNIESYRDVSRFLEKSTDGRYSWDMIKVDQNGVISGLPAKMCELLNSRESNGRYEQLRDEIYRIMDCKAQGTMQEIVDFTVKYHWTYGEVVQL